MPRLASTGQPATHDDDRPKSLSQRRAVVAPRGLKPAARPGFWDSPKLFDGGYLMSAEANLPDYESLEPAPVWRFFAGISAIPRPSKQEERIRAHLRGLPRSTGLPFVKTPRAIS